MSPTPNISRISLLVALMAVFSGLLGVSAAATQYKSSGGGTKNWDDPNSWTPAGVPGPGDDVVIQTGHTVKIDGVKTINKLEVMSAGSLLGDKDVNLTVTTTITIHRAGSIYGGNDTFGGDGGDVTIHAGGQLDNHGVIEAGLSSGASNENRTPPTEGKKGREGGETKVTSSTGIHNGGTGTIQGGRGSKGDSTLGTPNGGNGGTCDVTSKKVVNDGAILGGAGGTGQAASPAGHGADGGQVGVPDHAENGGTIRGGRGGLAPPGKKGGKGGACWVDGTKNTGLIEAGRGGDGRYANLYITGRNGVAVLGANATLKGGEVIVQAHASTLTLSALADGAIQATEGRVVLLSAGTLNVQGNLRSFAPKIVAKTGILVLATTVMESFRGQFIGMCSTTPTVKPRAQIKAEVAPQVGNTYSMIVYSPADARNAYYCLCALSASIGFGLDGFGSLQLDYDMLFILSALNVFPFVNFSGMLDGSGQGSPSVAIPAVPQLVGLDLFFQAVVVQGTGLTNMTLANQVKINP